MLLINYQCHYYMLPVCVNYTNNMTVNTYYCTYLFTYYVHKIIIYNTLICYIVKILLIIIILYT